MRSDANIFIHRDKCFVCGICVERCILDNLRMYLAPCRAACPIHMNCQGYVRLIAQGKEEEAAREMRKDLPFGGIVGRVCHHPCEASCERREVDEGSVHIRALKRYLADQFPEIAHASDPVPEPTGKRVAIAGSGPAGLMAAFELSLQGHGVTILERGVEPGGMLRWAIPSFRLPTEEVAKAVGLLERMGVAFQTGRSVGGDLELGRLEREWDAVLLATGGGSEARLGIPGEEMEGVHSGLGLLRAARGGTPPQLGRSAMVIGGGNTAVDAALVCRRMGVQEVTIVCLEDRAQMPAFPKEIDDALEEGIHFQNGWGPRRILRDDTGRLQLELSRCVRVFDDEGGFSPLLADVGAPSAPVDSVLVAIGQVPNRVGLPADLLSGPKGRFQADPLTLQTPRPKVFAAGDAISGPRSVIEAMAQGREAAISIARMLQGEGLRWGRQYWDGTCITGFPIDRSRAVVRPRALLPKVEPGSREFGVDTEGTLSGVDARHEAERCLNCGRPGEVNQTCWYCLPCEIECPVDALEVRMPYLVR